MRHSNTTTGGGPTYACSRCGVQVPDRCTHHCSTGTPVYPWQRIALPDIYPDPDLPPQPAQTFHHPRAEAC